VLQSIALERPPARALGPDEVEIAVRAVGLNFKDVVVAMGMLPPRAWEHGLSGAELGIDCAGVVTAVGTSVQELKRGDEVLGCAPACLGNRAVADRHLWVRKPKELSFEQAAALPTVYATAVLGLEKLAQLSAGETVLIHSGAGGVGIAAIHIAKALGAKIFATTSSADKRAFLKSLGVDQIFDSRGTSFHDEVRAATNGRGVDVVLNALTGKQLTQGLRCLAPFGRFIEIGKADLYSNRQVGLEVFGENRSFQVLDVNRYVKGRPADAGRAMTRIVERVASGELPALPVRAFPVQQAAQAVQALAQGRHIGKIVVSVPAEGTVEVRAPKRLAVPPQATCLITGGTQGFGLDIAGRLVERGAQHVVLASRSGTADPARLEALRAQGATVETVGCDVAEPAQVEALVSRLPKLWGVFHCAMVLDDAPLAQLDAARFARVSAPKARGAWNLHQAVKGRALEHFVTCSSIASVLGTPGQANYAAANAFLDSLAAQRRADGQAALSVGFGVLDTGVVARASSEQRRKILSQGVGAFSASDALDGLEEAMINGSGHEVIANVSWERVGALLRSEGRPPRFEGLTAKSVASADAGLRERVLALDANERAAFLAARLAEHVAAVLGLKEAADVDLGLGRYGLDSLMSVQLQTYLQDRLGVAIPLMGILRGPSIRELATQVVDAMAKTQARSHSWLTRVHGPSGQPSARLFCFSYLTADEGAYAHWAASLDPSVELWRISYPELGGEHDALLRGPTEALRERAAEELLPLTDLPFGFYGHSMGGWVALDLARALEHKGRSARFIAAGALPTHATMRALLPVSNVATPEDISEDLVLEVLKRMKVAGPLIEQPALRDAIVARTRRDLWLGLNAHVQRGDWAVERPKGGLWLFGGADDPMSTADKETASALQPNGVEVLPGGHLFVEEPVAGAALAQRLSAWLAAS
jgi:NADPH:quinone reductase-like Zn-dependent oxidoreductase/surfactin synthase thioesterase subunit/NADP-dependent 3-hydroxy acid dehydrogenase YdfG/acyl carrier protein